MTSVNLSLPASADGGLESLVFASAREQARALADGRVTAVALLEQALARMERHEAQLNAVPVRAVAQARNDALQADAALQRGERRPLLGVPITVKENFDVAGLATTVGNPVSVRLDRVSDRYRQRTFVSVAKR